MTFVQSCPKTKDTYLEASRRLGCVNDTYHHNQYICLPNTGKTSLVEFCNNAIMGIQEKGSCLEASVGKLIRHSCQNFSLGCPKNDFWEYEYYNYPACQYINTKHHCYVMDPSCPPDVQTEEKNKHDTIILACSVIGGLLVLIIAVVIFIWKLRKGEHQKQESNPKQTTSVSELPKSDSTHSDSWQEKVKFIKWFCKALPQEKDDIIRLLMKDSTLEPAASLPELSKSESTPKKSNHKRTTSVSELPKSDSTHSESNHKRTTSVSELPKSDSTHSDSWQEKVKIIKWFFKALPQEKDDIMRLLMKGDETNSETMELIQE